MARRLLERTGARAWIVVGLLTATQIGIGVWRSAVMLQDGLASGVQPLGWTAGLGVDLLMCGLLAAAAWWCLPVQGERSAGAWGARFLLLSWSLLLAHYAWGLAAGRMAPLLTWVLLAAYFAIGAWARRRGATGAAAPLRTPLAAGRPPDERLARWIAVAAFAAQLPHLVVPYGYADAKLIWACRAFKIAEHGALTGMLDCLDPARPPLHAVMLWLGIANPTFQGRLLPLLMFGAFVLVFHRLVRRVAPRLAVWAVVWLLVTDHVVKGQISSYTGVPEMLAVVIALAVVIDERALAPTRGFALLLAIVAGAVIALMRRDGLPEFVVVAVGLVIVTRRWRDPLAWAPLGAAAVAYVSWVLRPEVLQGIPAFPPILGSSAGVLYQVADATPPLGEHLLTLLYGAQGQVFSHYGYGAFAWVWLIVAIWAWRRATVHPQGSVATLYGIAGLGGWLATLAAYAALTVLGHPYMSSLFVVRTGFGRHLVHFFPLCLLHAAAAAQRLIGARAPAAS